MNICFFYLLICWSSRQFVFLEREFLVGQPTLVILLCVLSSLLTLVDRMSEQSQVSVIETICHFIDIAHVVLVYSCYPNLVLGRPILE